MNSTGAVGKISAFDWESCMCNLD